ncbi:hypothetical protein PA7559_22130 [Pseudoalteromonas distincta]
MSAKDKCICSTPASFAEPAAIKASVVNPSDVYIKILFTFVLMLFPALIRVI